MSITQLEVEKEKWLRDSEQRAIVNTTLAKRRAEERAAADTTEQSRFEKSYAQTERHHEEGKRAARIAAAISIIGAAASWAGVWFSHSQAQRVQQSSPIPAAAVAAPTPTATQQQQQ